MSPRVEFIAVAQRVISDTTTFTLTLVDLVENINIRSNAFPEENAPTKWHSLSPPPQVLVIFEWSGEKAKPSIVEQVIVTPTGAKHVVPFLEPFQILPPPVKHERPRARGLWHLVSLPINVAGRYELQILIDGEVATSYALSVNKIAVEAPGQTSSS